VPTILAIVPDLQDGARVVARARHASEGERGPAGTPGRIRGGSASGARDGPDQPLRSEPWRRGARSNGQR